MKCPVCHKDTWNAAKFCFECGTSLTTCCSRCGALPPDGANFCPDCGDALRSSTAPTVAVPADVTVDSGGFQGERKQVTVLFADISSSFELLANQDPEDARRILDAVVQRMIEAVHRYEGTVNQTMGDGIMALFGAPVALEEHAVRACYAALSIRDAVRRYAQHSADPRACLVRIRIGLNSGEVVVRSIRSHLQVDYTAVGHTVHLAARMQQMAGVDGIWLTANTMKLSEGYVLTTSLGPMEVRGLGKTIPVYELVGTEPVRSRLQVAAARGLSPFLGRETELAQLAGALEQTWAGLGQLVAVVGDPGVGKSRLVWELTHSDRTRPWLVFEVTATSYAQTTPFFVIVDLLKSYFGIEPGDDPRRVHEKITTRLQARGAPREVASALLALLEASPEGDQFGMLDPQERRARILAAVTDVVLRETDAQPVLLVVEDLQWADSETLRCLDAIIARLPTARLCVVLTYRSGFEHRWTSKTYYHQVRVDPLSRHSLEALLDSLLGKDASLGALRSLLVQRTEGNPFFLEESVRMLADSGVLAGERRAYTLSAPVAEVQVPSTVQAVLASRIDRRPAEEKRLLQCAAVIGQDVPFGLLVEVTALPPMDVRTIVGRLQAAEFLYESRLFPELEYTFRHALTHDVAYGTLLLERRRELHARALAAMERRYADDLRRHAEALALQALGGEVLDKALDYLRESGARAYARGALRKALDRYEQALALLPRLPETDDNRRRGIDVRLDLHAPLFAVGQISRLTELHREAARLAETLADIPRLGRVSARLGLYSFTDADYARGIEHADRAIEIARSADDVELSLVGVYLLGINHVALGNVAKAAEYFHDIVDGPHAELSKRISGLSAAPYVLAGAWLAGAHSMQGDFRRAQAYAERAVEAADASDHPYAQAIAYTWRVIPIAHRGAFADALPLCAHAVELCEKKELLGWVPFAYALWGWVLAWTGRAVEGATYIERAVTLFETVGIKAFVALRYVEWAEALLLAGSVEQARRTATQALELATAHGERANETWARCVLGEVALAASEADVSAARRHYEEGRNLAERLGLLPLLARCHLGLGQVHLRTQDVTRARSHLRAASELYRAIGSDYWLGRVEEHLTALDGA